MRKVRMNREEHDGAQMSESGCEETVLNDYLWSEGDEQETFNNSANKLPLSPGKDKPPMQSPLGPLSMLLPIMQNRMLEY